MSLKKKCAHSLKSNFIYLTKNQLVAKICTDIRHYKVLLT